LNKYDLKIISEIIEDDRFENFRKNYLDTIRQNIRYLRENLDDRLEVADIDGSTACLIDISQTDYGDIEFVEKLMEEHNLGLVPASYFYQLESPRKNDRIRIALGRPKNYMEEAVERLNETLNE
jgi:aspartate/methionine/tyrosine aminotransferase